MDCREQNYELIGEIIAVPADQMQWAAPWNEMQKHIAVADFSYTEGAEMHIPLVAESGNLKESAVDDVAGRSYEVVVTWQVEEVTVAAIEQLEALKRGVNHLILRTFPDNDMIVRSHDYAQGFDYHEEGGVLVCEYRVHNLVGAQRVLS